MLRCTRLYSAELDFAKLSFARLRYASLPAAAGVYPYLTLALTLRAILFFLFIALTFWAFNLRHLVLRLGFEPRTRGLKARCSDH